MSVEPTEDEQGAEAENIPDLYAENVDVGAGGLVTIPAKYRREFDIGHRDVVDVMIAPVEGGEVLIMNDQWVSGEGRICIPDQRQYLYDIEDGDIVHVGIWTTDKRYYPGE